MTSVIRSEDYPAETRIGAIPEALFVAGQASAIDNVLIIDEEHTLRAHISPNHVVLVDTEDNRYGFDMRLTEHGIGRKALTLVTRTKWHDSQQGNEQRYPGLYAGKLFARAVQHFDAIHGPVDYFFGRWDTGSDNRQQYEAALAQYENPTYLERRRAAFATWSGAQALKHGFKNIIGDVYSLKAVDGTMSISAEFTRIEYEQRRRRSRSTYSH